MRLRNANVLLASAAVLVAVLVLVRQLQETSTTTEAAATSIPPTRSQKSLTRVVDYQQTAGQSPDSLKVRKVAPGEILANVNGEPIFLRDLIPIENPTDTNPRELSGDVFSYLLDRAIVRELVTQEARRLGIGLRDDEQKRLADQREQRTHGGPGYLHSLNASPASLEFELRDAQAFMLQTNLLAAEGASPHVTSAQVLDYFHQHVGEFDPLPEAPAQREAAWREIDNKIRNRLASAVRGAYDKSLAVRMDSLKAAATIDIPTGPVD